jgi:hypothetical protein
MYLDRYESFMFTGSFSCNADLEEFSEFAGDEILLCSMISVRLEMINERVTSATTIARDAMLTVPWFWIVLVTRRQTPNV